MPTYAALGDSMSIDVYAGGPGRGAASLLLRNRDDDFPDWAGRDLRTRTPDVGFHLLATDGGTSATLVEYQLPRLVRLGVVPSLVTLTVGGAPRLRQDLGPGHVREAAQLGAAERQAAHRRVDARGPPVHVPGGHPGAVLVEPLTRGGDGRRRNPAS